MEKESRSERAHFHESKRPIYDALIGGNDIAQTPFLSLKDVFMIAACLGYKIGARKELKSGKKSDIRMEVFSEKERDILKAIALAETGNIHVLEKKSHELISGDVLNIAEEYANGGIDELKTLIVDKPGYNLFNLVDVIKSS